LPDQDTGLAFLPTQVNSFKLLAVYTGVTVVGNIGGVNREIRLSASFGLVARVAEWNSIDVAEPITPGDAIGLEVCFNANGAEFTRTAPTNEPVMNNVPIPDNLIFDSRFVILIKVRNFVANSDQMIETSFLVEDVIDAPQIELDLTAA
jgi:hypothetical protein